MINVYERLSLPPINNITRHYILCVYQVQHVRSVKLSNSVKVIELHVINLDQWRITLVNSDDRYARDL